MAAPIPPMLKYSVVHKFLNSPPILIKFESKSIVCKVLYFKAQYALMLCSPLRIKIKKVKLKENECIKIDVEFGMCFPITSLRFHETKLDQLPEVITKVCFVCTIDWLVRQKDTKHNFFGCPGFALGFFFSFATTFASLIFFLCQFL